MNIRFVELNERLREGGLEKAAADMARYLGDCGITAVRGEPCGPEVLEADLVHFHGLWSPAHYAIARRCRRAGIPCVVSPHGMLEPWAWRHRRWKKWPYFHLLEKRRLMAADALLATADAEAENLRRFFPRQRIDVITLGIEPDVGPDYAAARRTLGWADDERVLLYLSRVHPKKGLLELLQALVDVAGGKAVPGLRLVILGDGPPDYVAQCRRLAATLQELLPVDWLPPQWGLAKWDYLKGADLFCLPTYSENFGIVMLEAGIVGTPVFTTTGTPWRPIQDAGYGWVVDPDPAEYRRVLREFLALPPEAARALRGPFSRWTRENYAWPSVIGRYASFYRNLVEGAS